MSTIKSSFYVLLLISAAVLIYVSVAFKVDDAAVDNERVTFYNDGWSYADENQVQVSVQFPFTMQVPPGKELVLSNTLPQNLDATMSICFMTSRQMVQVAMDDRIIYEFGTNDYRPFGKSPGTAWHLIRIPADAQGKKITITTNSQYAQFNRNISSVTLGSKSANLFYIIRQGLPGAVICLLIFLCGIGVIVVHAFTKKKLLQRNELLYLGVFDVVVSMWSITETQLLQLVVSNQFAVSIFSFLTLQLCPVPLLLFMKETSRRSRRRIYDVLILLFLVNAAVSILLQVTNVADFVETVFVTHMLILLSALYSLYVLTKEVIIHKGKELRLLTTGVVVLIVFASMDLFGFYRQGGYDCSYWFRIGLLLHAVMVGIHTSRKAFTMIELGVEAKALEKLAYIDILTQKKNRTAFDLEIKSILPNIALYKNIIMVVFDLDNFKKVNDMYGHTVGDEVLISFAQLLEKAFGKAGGCFRIGGDEFVAVLKNCREEQVEEYTKELKESIVQYNQTHSNHLHVSSGYAQFDAAQDKDLYSLMDRADSKMYECKKMRKQQMFAL